MANQNFRVKTGLEVGTAVTISGGIVTATSFVGSGSRLTNISANYSNISGVSSSVVGGAVSATSLRVTGISTFDGDVKVRNGYNLDIGDNNDLRIYNDGTDSRIEETGLGSFYISGSDINIQQHSTNKNFARFVGNAAELYYNDNKKFSTSGAGVTVTGTLVADSVGIGTTLSTTTLQVNGTTKVETGIGSTQSVWTTTLDSQSNVNNVSLLVQPGTAYTGVAGRVYQPVVFSSSLNNASANNPNLYGLSNYTNISSQATSNSRVYGVFNSVNRNSTTDTSSTALSAPRLYGIWNEVIQGINVSNNSNSVLIQVDYNLLSLLNGKSLNAYVTSNIINVGTIVDYSASISNLYGSYNLMTVGTSSGTGIATVTNYYSYYSRINIGGLGKIDNYYGLYLENPSVSGTLSNRYSIYSSDASSSMYHQGNVLVGSATSTGTASQSLQVTGGGYFSGSVGIGTTNTPDSLTILGRVQVQQDSGSNNRLILRGQPGSSYRWSIDNNGSSNDFRIFREDDATTANGSVAVSISTTGKLSDSKGDVRAIPQNSQTSAYILAASDIGKHIGITTGGVTVNAGIFSVGDAVSIYNNSSSNQTITQGTSVTMYLVGTATTGNRTLAQRGVATILCVGTDTFVIMGGGLT